MARWDFLQLRRLVGLPTATEAQEGQLRYSRDGAVDGKLYVGRMLSGGTYEWMEIADAADIPTVPTSSPALFASASDDASTAVTTALANVLTVAIGPLLDGVTYDVEVNVTMRGSVDTTGFVLAYARIGSSSSVVGTKTGTVAGERTILATASETRVGTGATVTLAARAEMSTSTGSVTGVHIAGRAIPRF